MKGGLSEIEYLTKRTRDHQAELQRERERKKPKPNENMDADVQDFLSEYDFWCDLCQEDFTSPAVKTVSSFEGSRVVLVRGIHEDCETESIRYATHRDQDPYYDRSLKVKQQRDEYAADFLQAEEYGFKAMYNRDPYSSFNNRLREREAAILTADRELGFRGTSIDTRERLKKIRHQASRT